MNISAKIEYASIAVLELAANYNSGKPVRIRTIAQAHGIPSRFLVQILLQLKGANLVISTRSAAGGYRLAKDPSELKLGEVMGAIEGQTETPTSNAGTQTAISHTLWSVWNEVTEVERDMLSSITFAELVERVRGQTEEMYYI